MSAILIRCAPRVVLLSHPFQGLTIPMDLAEGTSRNVPKNEWGTNFTGAVLNFYIVKSHTMNIGMDSGSRACIKVYLWCERGNAFCSFKS